MSFTLDCSIDIGRYRFDGVSEVQIVNSHKQLGNTASIKLPNKWSGKYLCNVINGGDKVVINLGYNGELRQEFVGYVRDVAYNTPVEINCEDEFYKLKRDKPVAKSFPSTTLHDILKHLVSDISIQKEVPNLTLINFSVKAERSIYFALQQIRDTYLLEMYFKKVKDDLKLFCGIPMTEMDVASSEVVIYDLERNVIDPKLNYHRAVDVRLKIEVQSTTSDNKIFKAQAGDDEVSATMTIKLPPDITNVDELYRQAEIQLRNYKYDGFDGSMTTFGLPYIEPGMIAKIIDKRFDGAREGKYLCDSVTTTFGMGGFRREVKIGRKMG